MFEIQIWFIPIYNLIEQFKLFWHDSQLMGFYSKNEATNFNADIVDDDIFKSFKYKTKLLRNTEANGVPLKCHCLIAKKKIKT